MTSHTPPMSKWKEFKSSRPICLMGLVSLALFVPRPILIFFQFVFAYLYLVNQFNSFHDLNICLSIRTSGWLSPPVICLFVISAPAVLTNWCWLMGRSWWWGGRWRRTMMVRRGLHIISLAVLLVAGHLKMFLKIIIFWFCRLHFCSCLLGLIFKKSMQRRSWSSKKWRSASNVV